MAESLPIDMTMPRSSRLEALVPMLSALLEEEPSGWANLANASAAMMSASGWHWVGFYLVDASEDNLVLGPFQGPVACTRLFRRKGVCAAAWERNKPVVVEDVDAFPGHVACSSASRSEVVLPIRGDQGEVIGVLDVDSDQLAAFDATDAAELLKVADLIGACHDA